MEITAGTEILFSGIFTVFSIYINFRVIQIFVKQRKERRQFSWCIYLAVWVFYWTLFYNILDNLLLLNGALLGGLFMAVMLLYEDSVCRKVVAVSAAVALRVLSEKAVWLFLEPSLFGVNRAFGCMLSAILSVFVIFLIENFVYFAERDILPLKSQLNSIIILVGSVIIGNIMVTFGKGALSGTMIGMSVLCLINISAYYLYGKINDVYLQKYEKSVAVQQAKMYENQLLLLHQSQESIRVMQHDMKNHMLLLKSYLEHANYEGAEGYIESAMKTIAISGQYVQSGNMEIDAIVNYMLGRAEKMSCEIETEIAVPDTGFMSEFDLNILLSNLLDNALEALERVEEKYLFVGLKYERGVLIVKIYNTYDGELRKEGEEYVTRKKDKERHGIGLKSVDAIISKYNGELKRETTDTLFKTDLLLYVSK